MNGMFPVLLLAGSLSGVQAGSAWDGRGTVGILLLLLLLLLLLPSSLSEVTELGFSSIENGPTGPDQVLQIEFPYPLCHFCPQHAAQCLALGFL